VVQGEPDPKIINSSLNLPLAEMVSAMGDVADFAYEYSADQTLTGMSDSWGNPTNKGTSTPISYDGPINIVYFNMNGNKTAS
jgi:hypothetical protein